VPRDVFGCLSLRWRYECSNQTRDVWKTGDSEDFTLARVPWTGSNTVKLNQSSYLTRGIVNQTLSKVGSASSTTSQSEITLKETKNEYESLKDETENPATMSCADQCGDTCLRKKWGLCVKPSPISIACSASCKTRKSLVRFSKRLVKTFAHLIDLGEHLVNQAKRLAQGGLLLKETIKSKLPNGWTELDDVFNISKIEAHTIPGPAKPEGQNYIIEGDSSVLAADFDTDECDPRGTGCAIRGSVTLNFDDLISVDPDSEPPESVIVATTSKFADFMLNVAADSACPPDKCPAELSGCPPCPLDGSGRRLSEQPVMTIASTGEFERELRRIKDDLGHHGLEHVESTKDEFMARPQAHHEVFSLCSEFYFWLLISLFKHSGHAAQLLETQVHGLRSRVQATHGSHSKGGRGRSLADKAEGRRRLSEVYAMPPHIPICVCMMRSSTNVHT
jgi:hypothetical protein